MATPVQRGTQFETEVAPTTTTVIIDADTYQDILKEYDVTEIMDNQAETVDYVFSNAKRKIECEATVIAGQDPPSQGDLVTLTFADTSTLEMVVRGPVPVTGFGKVKRVKLQLEKPAADLSPS